MFEVLRVLDVPRTVSEVARITGYSEESVRQMLRLLKGRGYVSEVSCAPACGVCPLRNLCPSPEPTGGLWLITEKGRAYLTSVASPSPGGPPRPPR